MPRPRRSSPKGIHKDDIIMVQLPNTWELAMLYLAITRAGALISPMPMQWRFLSSTSSRSMTDAAALITVEEFGGFKHGEMAGKIQAKHPSLKQIITLPEIREMTKGEVTGKLDRDHHRSQRRLHPLLVLRDGGGAQGMPAQPQQLAVPVLPLLRVRPDPSGRQPHHRRTARQHGLHRDRLRRVAQGGR